MAKRKIKKIYDENDDWIGLEIKETITIKEATKRYGKKWLDGF